MNIALTIAEDINYLSYRTGEMLRMSPDDCSMHTKRKVPLYQFPCMTVTTPPKVIQQVHVF
jgi:hypothetical protein